MAQSFNFETRELVPYNDNWNRGGNVKIFGALWYIKERDGLYLIDNDKSRPQPENRPYREYNVSCGLPAALLAQGDALFNPEFDFRACYQAYFKTISKLFPTKPTHFVPTILQEWAFTLNQAFPYDHNVSGFIDNFSMMKVAAFIRDISNPYRTDSLIEKLNHSYYYTCNLTGKEKPQIIISGMPSFAERIEAPFIYMLDIDQTKDKAVVQADGFLAAIINLAMFYHWQRRWSEFNFTDNDLIEKILIAFEKPRPLIDIANLHRLSFDFPDEVADICEAYMDAFVQVTMKVWKHSPTVQLACTDGDNIYTYLYAHEVSSPERLLKSELYANLTATQKRILYHYGRRFLEWLARTYNVTTLSQHRVMNAVARDMPQIQMQINNFVKITRAGDFEGEDNMDEPMKFKYILSDDLGAIGDIHKRIELHLLSPAELRDELRKLHNDGVISLPMDKPTEIIREVIRVWGDKAPKERSFVTTWGRRA